MYDHAQSPRLGQRTPNENPGVQLVTLETLPEVARRGQMVYLLDQQELRVHDGTAWQAPGSTSQTFVGDTAPVADHVGDQWLNTTDYQLYVWDGSQWRVAANNRQLLTNQQSLKLAMAVKQLVPIGVTPNVVVTYDTAPPVVPDVNDIWAKVDTNTVFLRTASSWSQVLANDVTDAILAAGDARATPDLQIELFYDTVSPIGLTAQDIGDVWTVTNQNNLVRVWDGAAWLDAQVTTDAIQEQAVTSALLANHSVTGLKVQDFTLNYLKLVSTKYHII